MNIDYDQELAKIESKLSLITSIVSAEVISKEIEIDTAGLYYFLSDIVGDIQKIRSLDLDPDLLGLDTIQCDDGGNGFK